MKTFTLFSALCVPLFTAASFNTQPSESEPTLVQDLNKCHYHTVELKDLLDNVDGENAASNGQVGYFEYLSSKKGCSLNLERIFRLLLIVSTKFPALSMPPINRYATSVYHEISSEFMSLINFTIYLSQIPEDGGPDGGDSIISAMDNVRVDWLIPAPPVSTY